VTTRHFGDNCLSNIRNNNIWKLSIVVISPWYILASKI